MQLCCMVWRKRGRTDLLCRCKGAMKAYLYLARMFGIVSFLRVENHKLTVPKWTLRLSLLVQSFMVTLYVIFAFQHEQVVYLFNSISSKGVADERFMFTSLTIVFNFAIDFCNIFIIVFNSQSNHKLANVLLKHFADIDKQLPSARRLRWNSDILMTIFTASVFIARVFFIFSQFDKFKVSFNIGIGTRFIYGMTCVAEQLNSLMCMEIKSRYKKFHLLLKMQAGGGDSSYKEVRALSSLFYSLRDGHMHLARHVRAFLLLDIAQLVLLVIHGILSVFLVCLVPKESDEQKLAAWCVSNGTTIATDCLWRVCFLVFNCGALQNEVRSQDTGHLFCLYFYSLYSL